MCGLYLPWSRTVYSHRCASIFVLPLPLRRNKRRLVLPRVHCHRQVVHGVGQSMVPVAQVTAVLSLSYCTSTRFPSFTCWRSRPNNLVQT